MCISFFDFKSNVISSFAQHTNRKFDNTINRVCHQSHQCFAHFVEKLRTRSRMYVLPVFLSLSVCFPPPFPSVSFALPLSLSFVLLAYMYAFICVCVCVCEKRLNIGIHVFRNCDAIFLWFSLLLFIYLLSRLFARCFFHVCIRISNVIFWRLPFE